MEQNPAISRQIFLGKLAPYVQSIRGKKHKKRSEVNSQGKSVYSQRITGNPNPVALAETIVVGKSKEEFTAFTQSIPDKSRNKFNGLGSGYKSEGIPQQRMGGPSLLERKAIKIHREIINQKKKV